MVLGHQQTQQFPRYIYIVKKIGKNLKPPMLLLVFRAFHFKDGTHNDIHNDKSAQT